MEIQSALHKMFFMFTQKNDHNKKSKEFKNF